MRERATTLAELAGMSSITAGVYMLSLPAALVVGGVFLVVIGFLEGMK